MMDQSTTGADIIVLLRSAAERRGVSLCGFVGPLTRHPNHWLDQLGRARQPTARTRDRVAALIEGRPIPGLGESGSVGAQVALEAEEWGARRLLARNTGTVKSPVPGLRSALGPDAAAVDRDPCPYCGTRGDIGCRHKPRSYIGGWR